MNSKVSINSMTEYLKCSREKYDACLDSIAHDLVIEDFEANLRFHHLKFDSNGRPKFSDLAEVLADHITWYCFSTRRRNKPVTDDDYSRLNREARALLRKWSTSGESGEILLYFLLDAVIGAPQLVAKMELKTNPKLEVHGSDGIHMKWHKTDSVLDIYFGEAKLEQTIYSALDNAFESIDKFHKEGLLTHEFGLVTSHYKWADDDTKEIILKLVDRQQPGGDCRINHACLIGYDWEEYNKLNGKERKSFIQDFKKIYKSDAPRLHSLIKKRFDKFEHTFLRFEVFFLPFKSVQEFRDAFNAAAT